MKAATLFLLLFTATGFTQETTYKLVLIDSCSNKVEAGSLLYHLEKNGKEYTISDLESESIILPEKGEYKLFVPEIEEEHIVVIERLINVDTLAFPKIVEKIVWPPYSFKKGLDENIEKKIKQKNLPKFWNCNEKCNGPQTSYYSNGNLKLSGNFQNGLAIGKLQKYYQSGKVKEISFYDKDGFLTKKTLFDENGEILKKP